MTAVEWFLTEIEKRQYFIGNDMLEAYNQAKEMEKQQIIEAHGLIAKLQEDGSHKLISGETYYDETYKNKTK
jgi:hypothetical protein